MTDDPDELRMEQEIRRKDPARVGDALEAIFKQGKNMQQTLNTISFQVVLLIVLLALILWRIW